MASAQESLRFKLMENEVSYRYVCAMHVGNSKMGYFYNCTDIGSEGVNGSFSTDTALLLTDEETSNVIGENALKLFAQYSDVYLIWKFKMQLHSWCEDRMQIKAFGRDKKFKSILVYSEIYRWMKEHFLENVADDRLTADEVLWVLTVPGTWDNRTHHMIRQAGINAGLCCERDVQRVVLVLETEAATVHHSPGSQNQNTLVIKADGDSAELCALEVGEHNLYRSVLPPTGGPWGADHITEQIMSFLRSCISESVYDKAMKQDPAACYWFMHDAYRRIYCWSSGDLELAVVHTLKQAIRAEGAEEKIKERSRGHAHMKRGMIVISEEKIKSYFTQAVNGICEHCKSAETRETLSKATRVLFIGEFAQNDFFLKTLDAFLKRTLPGAKMVLERDLLEYALGAIPMARDAVQHFPMVSSRVASKSYGAKTIYQGANEEREPIVMLISSGKTLRAGGAVERTSLLRGKIYIYSSQDENLINADEGGRTLEAVVSFEGNIEDPNRKVYLVCKFGTPELDLSLKDESGESNPHAVIDYKTGYLPELKTSIPESEKARESIAVGGEGDIPTQLEYPSAAYWEGLWGGSSRHRIIRDWMFRGTNPRLTTEQRQSLETLPGMISYGFDGDELRITMTSDGLEAGKVDAIPRIKHELRRFKVEFDVGAAVYAQHENRNQMVGIQRQDRAVGPRQITEAEEALAEDGRVVQGDPVISRSSIGFTLMIHREPIPVDDDYDDYDEYKDYDEEGEETGKFPEKFPFAVTCMHVLPFEDLRAQQSFYPGYPFYCFGSVTDTRECLYQCSTNNARPISVGLQNGKNVALGYFYQRPVGSSPNCYGGADILCVPLSCTHRDVLSQIESGDLTEVGVFDLENRRSLVNRKAYVTFSYPDQVVRAKIERVNDSVKVFLRRQHNLEEFIYDKMFCLILEDYRARSGESGCAVFIVEGDKVLLLAMHCAAEAEDVHSVAGRPSRVYSLLAYDGINCISPPQCPYQVFIPTHTYEQILEAAQN